MADTTPVEGEIVKNELAIILDEQGVSPENQKTLVEAFGGPFNEVGDILANFSTDEETGELITDKAIKVTSVDQREEMLKAKEQRLALKNARTTVERKRKELKEDSLKTGRAIDAVARFVKTTIEPAEKYLETQEKFAELKAAAEKSERLAARTSAISKFADPSMYNLADMEEEPFQELLIKLEKEESDRVEAERVAREKQEAEAKAEQERQVKIQEENDRLQREAKERAAAEQRKMDRVNQVTTLGLRWDPDQTAYVGYGVIIAPSDILEYDDEKWSKMFSKAELIVKGEIEKERQAKVAADEAREAELAKEREAAEAAQKKADDLEKAAAERKAAEEKAAADKANAEHQALLAPDKDKLTALMSQIDGFRTENIPAVKSKEAQAVINIVDEKLIGLIATIQEQVEKM